MNPDNSFQAVLARRIASEFFPSYNSNNKELLEDLEREIRMTMIQFNMIHKVEEILK